MLRWLSPSFLYHYEELLEADVRGGQAERYLTSILKVKRDGIG